MNKYNVKNDCIDKAKHFSIMKRWPWTISSLNRKRKTLNQLIILYLKQIMIWNKTYAFFMLKSKIINKESYFKIKY